MLNFSHFWLIIIELLLPLLLGEFIAIPETYTVGNSVILRCHLQAPNGTQFVSTVPVLTTDEISNPFTFDRIQEALDGRYHGFHIPDKNRTNLKGDISILFLRESDLKINFTCLQQLENRTLVQFTLSLNTSTKVGSNEHISTTNYTSPACPSFSNKTVEECTIWKVFSSFNIALLLLIIILVICIIVWYRFQGDSYRPNSSDIRSHCIKIFANPHGDVHTFAYSMPHGTVHKSKRRKRKRRNKH